MNTICPQVSTTSVQIMPSPSHSPKSCWVSGSSSFRNWTDWIQKPKEKGGMCGKALSNGNSRKMDPWLMCPLWVCPQRPSRCFSYRELFSTQQTGPGMLLWLGEPPNPSAHYLQLALQCIFWESSNWAQRKPLWNELVVWGCHRQLLPALWVSSWSAAIHP